MKRWRFLSVLLTLCTAFAFPGTGFAAAGTVAAGLTVVPPNACGDVFPVTLTIQGQTPPPGSVPLDVMLALDDSGSISSTTWARIRSASTHFVDLMDSNDGAADGTIANGRIGVAKFSTTAILELALTSNATTARNKTSTLVQRGGNTFITGGINTAQSQLAGSPRKPVMILMTDGQPNVKLNGQIESPPFTVAKSETLAAATAAKNAGTELYVIGLGSGVDSTFLQQVASGPDHYFFSPTDLQLDAIFEELATGVAGPAATNLSYTAAVNPGFTVVGATASAGMVTFTANEVRWTGSELRNDPVTVTYLVQASPMLGGVQNLQAVMPLTYTDSDGLPASLDLPALDVMLANCNQAPVANAGPDQALPMTGPAGADVQLDGSASTDDGLLQPLSYTWLEGATPIATGATPLVTLGRGVHSLTLRVDDGQYTAEDQVTVAVVDLIPPVTTASAPGGWQSGPVTVVFSATDQWSGVSATYYRIDGGAVASGTTANVSGSGTHTVAFWSVDNAGNAEAPQMIAVAIDMVAPTIAASAAPAPNGAGWNNTNVTVSFACADDLSGVASCPTDVLVSAEGAGQVISGTAVDNAGNSASASVTVSLDKTAPTVSYSGNAGSYTADQMVSIACAASDALSGLASSTCQPIAGPAYSFAAGANTFSATATDVAGNTGSATVTFTVQVTYDSLCTLVQQWVTKPGVAHSLCVKLKTAEEGHGPDGLRNFLNELDAQTGKSITPEHAAILRSLAASL